MLETVLEEHTDYIDYTDYTELDRETLNPNETREEETDTDNLDGNVMLETVWEEHTDNTDYT